MEKVRVQATVAALDYPGAITYQWSADSIADAMRDVTKWAAEDFSTQRVSVETPYEIESA